MGMPVVETAGSGAGTAGSGAGTAEASGIIVEPASWELGQVPLNVAARPTWTLRNTGDKPVTLGQPHPEVREGCCPGPATLGTRTLAPGDATTLKFVPVDDGTDTEKFLTLDVTGDFRS